MTPEPQGYDLADVWAFSRTDVWAVGYAGTILHWDGRGWSRISSGTTEALGQLWGAAPDDLWAAGYDVLLHWDGRAWTRLASPRFTGGIDGSGPRDLWTSGSLLGFMHFDGLAWSSVARPAPVASDSEGFCGRSSGRALWAYSPQVAWAAGGPGALLRWDGAKWSSVASGTTQRLTAVWGKTSEDVWAVGCGGAAVHWDGSRWSGVSTGARVDLGPLWGATSKDVWAIGDATILHWDGARWSSAGISFPGLRAVHGSAADDVWAVGDKGLLAHFDGRSWSRRSSGTRIDARAVWGSAADDVWIADGAEALHHWDGKTWSRTSVEVPQGMIAHALGVGGSSGPRRRNLGHIWGATARDVWAVGYDCILHYDGNEWATAHRGGAAPPAEDDLCPKVPAADPRSRRSTRSMWTAIWGRAADDVWAVGGGGRILHYDGWTWSPMPSPADGTLWDVWASSASDVWVLEDYRLFHWDGRAWTKAHEWPAHDVGALDGSGPNDVWVAGGSFREVMHWNGTAWSTLAAPEQTTTGRVSFTDVRALAPDDVWFGSGDGTLWHWDGRTWRESRTGVRGSVKGLWTPARDDVWALGDGGAVLRRRAPPPDHRRSAVEAHPGPGAVQAATEPACGHPRPSPPWTPADASLCSREGWCWEHPLPKRGALESIWGSSPADVWASGEQGSLLHWDGARWNRFVVATDDYLSAIWGSGPRDVWVGGAEGRMWHWDGASWSSQTTGTRANLHGVWGSGPGDVWALGEDGALVHWDGQSWRGVDSGTRATLRAIWGFGPADVWAVGEDRTILRFDGQRWKGAALLPGDYDEARAFINVWGSDPANVWVAQWDRGPLWHWNGRAWSRESIGEGGDSLYALGGSSQKDVWCAGSDANYHWDGRAWSKSIGSAGLTALWAFAGNDAFAVRGAELLRWDGGAWRSMLGRAPRIVAFAGPAENDVWAGGWSYGDQVVLHWDGSAWKDVAIPAGPVHALWAGGPNDVWAAGGSGGGVLVHWDGMRWSRHVGSLPHDLTDLWGAATDDVWAVGEGGTLIHWDGHFWSRASVRSSANFRSVSGTARDDVWVAGAQNALLHWDGDRWHQVMEEDYKHGRNHQWESVWARSRSDVWLAGGDLFHFDGTTWSQIATGPWHIKIVAGTPDGALWAIADGEEGGAQYADVLLRSQDGRWFRAETGAAQPIVAVWGVGKAIWAGGDHGMILRRR